MIEVPLFLPTGIVKRGIRHGFPARIALKSLNHSRIGCSTKAPVAVPTRCVATARLFFYGMINEWFGHNSPFLYGYYDLNHPRGVKFCNHFVIVEGGIGGVPTGFGGS